MIRSETFCRLLPAWHTIFATFWFVTSALLHLWHCALGYPGTKKIIKFNSIQKSWCSFFPILFARKFKTKFLFTWIIAFIFLLLQMKKEIWTTKYQFRFLVGEQSFTKTVGTLHLGSISKSDKYWCFYCWTFANLIISKNLVKLNLLFVSSHQVFAKKDNIRKAELPKSIVSNY